MNSVLKLSTISRGFITDAGTVDVLKGASLEIKPGELVALVGPSGSGKSTLLQIAGLLDTPQSGEIEIAGTDARASDAVRTKLRNRHIGFIYQFHNLLPELTAEENVALPLQIAGVPYSKARPRAQAYLERLGLEERMHHLPSQLSGGEQQRVAIARALVNAPELVLADEPTGNLDPKTSESVLQLFLQVAAEAKISALIATHNMPLAKRLNRAVTLKNGLIEQVTL